MSEIREIKQEELDKVSGGQGSVYSDEVDINNISNYVGGFLYFVGNQTFINSFYTEYIEVFAYLDSVVEKTYEQRKFIDFPSNYEIVTITKKVYNIKIMSGNRSSGSIIELIADGIKVYLSKDI